ncbi:MAG TPA: hypothetical protein VJ483_07655 [Holophagaceae bacterium]|nr:hypothetical protein [Holophagaceae bacterium]
MRTPAMSRQRGYSFAEVLVATGISGVLALCGMGLSNMDGPDLTAAQMELKGSLDQAMELAYHSGHNAVVSMSRDKGVGHVPVHLSRRVHWGKLAGVPMPPGTDAVKAANTGESIPRITVTPRRTVLAATWFLNDGQDVLYVHVNGRDRIVMLRWKHGPRKWVRV